MPSNGGIATNNGLQIMEDNIADTLIDGKQFIGRYADDLQRSIVILISLTLGEL